MWYHFSLYFFLFGCKSLRRNCFTSLYSHVFWYGCFFRHTLKKSPVHLFKHWLCYVAQKVDFSHLTNKRNATPKRMLHRSYCTLGYTMNKLCHKKQNVSNIRSYGFSDLQKIAAVIFTYASSPLSVSHLYIWMFPP